MVVFIKLSIILLNIFQLNEKCDCYEGEDSLGNIYTLSLKDNTYNFIHAVSFHGNYTLFTYTGNYVETSAGISIEKSFNEEPTFFTKKGKYLYLKYDLMPQVYVIRMKKVHCKRLKIEKVPDKRKEEFFDSY